ncbi:hypothetical protein [Sterolibacterium denitrificans]|uniref:hypothetical protein n=1 Tax=Sterolibacterium denitrificans TaxID=157592 RepID=UPI0012B68AE6|nr:hypothetical protein [Sterolibacterium denitrificans]
MKYVIGLRHRRCFTIGHCNGLEVAIRKLDDKAKLRVYLTSLHGGCFIVGKMMSL